MNNIDRIELIAINANLNQFIDKIWIIEQNIKFGNAGKKRDRHFDLLEAREHLKEAAFILHRLIKN